MAHLKFIILIPTWMILLITITTTLTTGFEDNCDKIECISSITQADCAEGSVLVPDLFGCCPRCAETGKKVCEECEVDEDCAIGLLCEGGEKCGFDKSSCHYLAHMNLEGEFFWKPECEITGAYKAKQCRGDKVSGRCFCFSETGQKIFGYDLRTKEEDMTCACSRHRFKLDADGHISTLHCQQNGNYEELQCEAGVCFCVEPKTGHLKAGTKVLPDTLWTQLPCYNKTLYGDMYMRQCESMTVVQKKVIKLFELHGTKDAAVEIANCNYDGSYGVQTLQKTEVKCIWRNGKIIEPYSGTFSQLGSIDCACAIDERLYEEIGAPFKLTCGTDGSYKEVQHHQNGKYYCVDALGYAVSDFEATKLTEEMCNSRRYDRIETESYCA